MIVFSRNFRVNNAWEFPILSIQIMILAEIITGILKVLDE